MSEPTTPTQTPATSEATTTEKQPGFFQRMLQKLDQSLKQKADEKSQESCCGTDSKGDKCC